MFFFLWDQQTYPFIKIDRLRPPLDSQIQQLYQEISIVYFINPVVFPQQISAANSQQTQKPNYFKT